MVELNCNANNIPEKLEFDLISSDIGDAIKISNIDLPEGVKPTIAESPVQEESNQEVSEKSLPNFLLPSTLMILIFASKINLRKSL